MCAPRLWGLLWSGGADRETVITEGSGTWQGKGGGAGHPSLEGKAGDWAAVTFQPQGGVKKGTNRHRDVSS